jgi:hypothetical protein
LASGLEALTTPGSLLGTLQGIPDVPWKKHQVFVGVFFFFFALFCFKAMN